jgi:hypothetical protein
MLTRDDIIKWAIEHGYTSDKFGHYQRTAKDRTIRLKLSNIAMRYEVKSYIVDHNEWIRLQSGYYKDLNINSKGQLAGLKR